MENTAPKTKWFATPWIQSLMGLIVILIILIGGLYLKSVSAYVYIDKSQIAAPLIVVGPESEGILSEVFVKAGDTVTAGEPLARVGAETLLAQTTGLVVLVNNTPGQVFMPGSAVVTMIEPKELRVIGQVDEDKGLAKLKVGEPALFTVDAFGRQTFTGVVDEISPTSDQTAVIFNISDKREIKQFTVKVKYDLTAHPAFKTGMSAKLRIYVK